MNSLSVLLAQAQAWSWSYLFRPETLVFAIPIVAILVGGITAISKMLIRHRERMAMIERGMHPDLPLAPVDPRDVP